MEIISLGGGVQSSTLVLMNLLGEIEPRAEAAYFADTGFEQAHTYQFLDWLIPHAEQHDFPIHVVSAGNLRDDVLASTTGETHIPFFTETDTPNGGQLRRQCTNHFKIRIINREVRKRHGFQKRKQWIGFSLDEIVRAAPSRVKYIEHRFPLLEKRMWRGDCVAWLKKNGFPIPGKSACVCCPYRPDSEWHQMKTQRPNEFAEAVAFDREIRDKHLHAAHRKDFKLYVHRSMKPLNEVSFVNESQLNLFEQEECTGGCWL